METRVLLALGWTAPRLDRVRALWPLAALAAAGAFVFAWMCDAVGDQDGVTAVDGPVSLWFAGHRSSVEGHLGLLVATATSPVVLGALVLALAVLLRRRGRRLESTLLVGGTSLAYAAGFVAKYAEHRARPVAPVNLAPESEPSFPSGHVLVVATVAFVLIGLAWSQLSRGARVLAVAAAAAVVALVALDRLVVGAHWLTDVVGSVALASVVVAVTVSAHRLVRPSA